MFRPGQTSHHRQFLFQEPIADDAIERVAVEFAQ
jgi:hypothetical protein